MRFRSASSFTGAHKTRRYLITAQQPQGTVDITPTKEGFATIKRLFEESITQHEADLAALEEIKIDLLPWLSEKFDSRAKWLVEEGLNRQVRAIEDSIVEMKDSIADLGKYLKATR